MNSLRKPVIQDKDFCTVIGGFCVGCWVGRCRFAGCPVWLKWCWFLRIPELGCGGGWYLGGTCSTSRGCVVGWPCCCCCWGCACDLFLLNIAANLAAGCTASHFRNYAVDNIQPTEGISTRSIWVRPSSSYNFFHLTLTDPYKINS